MQSVPRWVIVGTGIGILTVVVLLVGRTVNSQPPVKEATTEPAAPEGQTYVGAKKCSSCHLKQYKSWKASKHYTEAWEKVPAQYRTSAECLPCHTTGYGQETGFKDAESTPNLTGTSCEACHGPGSKHVEVCTPFLSKKKLSPEEDKVARDSIYKVLPRNVCASCHLVQGHKEHPKYEGQPQQ
jgi:hypothetical protein